MAFSTKAGCSVAGGVLLGMGNPLLDITVQGDQALLDRYNLLPNNAIIAGAQHHSLFAELSEKFSPSYIAGGATQNSIRIAQWLLRVPQATSFLGGVGDDKFEKILEDRAREVGVNVCYQVHKGQRTGLCAAIIQGENRSLVTELGAAAMFSQDFLMQPENWALVERARCFYIGGFILPVSQDAVLTIARHATEHQKMLVMNLHATFLCKHFADPKVGIMQHIDVLFGNGDEAVEFAKHQGMKTKDLKEIALQTASLPRQHKRERIVVFTQGKDPTILAYKGKVKEYPISKLDSSLIKDTNGCGDAFVGGFLSQLVQGLPIEECMRCGSYAAKVVIQNYGCTYPQKPDFS